jgi:hypothetical protein
MKGKRSSPLCFQCNPPVYLSANEGAFIFRFEDQSQDRLGLDSQTYGKGSIHVLNCVRR